VLLVCFHASATASSAALAGFASPFVKVACLFRTGSVAAMSDAPSADNFLRWGRVRSIVLNDFLYLDGVELSQLDDGQLRLGLPINSTVSIDLRTSWATNNAPHRALPKPREAPRTNFPVAWTDTKRGVFFSWADHHTFLDFSPTGLWMFKTDGADGGSWTDETSSNANPDFFKQLHSPVLGAAVTINDTIGLYLGGYVNACTELGRTDTMYIPGMVAFNMPDRTWYSGIVGFSPFGDASLLGSRAEYIPSYGPSGLVIVLGGTQSYPFFDFRTLEPSPFSILSPRKRTSK